MAKIDFPSPATQGDTYTQNNISWVYNGEAWDPTPASGGGGLANIVEDTTPELGGNLFVGTNAFTVSGTYGDTTVLGLSNSGSGSGDDVSIQILSGSVYGDPATIKSVDGSGSGFYACDVKLQSYSSNYGSLGKIQLDNYIFNSNESLTGKTNQVLTYNGSTISLAPAGGSASDLVYGALWNGNTDAATKNAIYDKIETLVSETEFDAAGDLLIGTGSNALNRLPIGSTDQVLTVSGGTATWATAAGGGGTTQGSSSTYDISAVARSSTPNARGNYSVDLQMQGNADDVASGTNSALIGGSFNSAAGTHGFITAGTGNTIPSVTPNSAIIASNNSSVGNFYGNNVILAHQGNAVVTTLSSYNSAIIGGSGQTISGAMGAGNCAILGGTSNSAYYADKSVILGGNDNYISHSSSCVIAGTRVKATGVSLGRLNGVFAFADNTAADYTITQEKTANFRVANGMHISAPLFIDERASALADIAGRGQIWVKNTTPNELWFTDDAGSDRPISEGVYTVATLPTGVAGRRAFVTDSGNTLASHHGQAVANGGANFVPVYHNGSAWLVG